MSSNQQAAIQLLRRLSITTALLCLVIGGGLILFLGGEQQSPAQLLLLEGAKAAFAGALAALIFTGLATRETEFLVDKVLQRVLMQVFTPFRARVENASLAGYRWYGQLSPPEPADPLGHHAILRFRLGYTREVLPSQVSIVCIASLEDAALEPYRDRSRYVMRWQIETHMDPADEHIFQPTLLAVDGLVIEAVKRTRVIEGYNVCEYSYKVPKAARGKHLNRLELSIRTRQSMVDAHVPVKVILFGDVTDAEFALSVDRSLGRQKLLLATNVVGLGPRGEAASGPMFPDCTALAAQARFGYPLQAGSSVTFYVDS